MDDTLEKPTTIVKEESGERAADAAGQSSDEEDGGPDWTRLAAFTASSSSQASSKPVIPKRGEKEFEPSGGIEQGGAGTGLQQHKLARIRAAMFAALDVERTVSSKSVTYAVWMPDISRARILTARGNHLLTMGHGVPREALSDQDTDKPARMEKVVELLPEESLLLIERSSMLCWTYSEDNRISRADDVDGAPMSVQQAYAWMIGREELTLERYQVYAYLKRLGYTVTRARAPDPFYVTPPPFSRLLRKQTSLIKRIQELLLAPLRWILRIRFTGFDWWKPLRLDSRVHRIGSYSSIFSALRIIPHGFSLPLRHRPEEVLPESPYEIFYNVYKPSTPFRKTAPPPPDFSVIVVNARTTPMPNIHELNRLFNQLPELPLPAPRKPAPQKEPSKLTPVEHAQLGPTFSERIFSFVFRLKAREAEAAQPSRPWRPNPFQMLKAGKKVVVVAAVDTGTISFFRFGQGAFDEWPMV